MMMMMRIKMIGLWNGIGMNMELNKGGVIYMTALANDPAVLTVIVLGIIILIISIWGG